MDHGGLKSPGIGASPYLHRQVFCILRAAPTSAVYGAVDARPRKLGLAAFTGTSLFLWFVSLLNMKVLL